MNGLGGVVATASAPIVNKMHNYGTSTSSRKRKRCIAPQISNVEVANIPDAAQPTTAKIVQNGENHRDEKVPVVDEAIPFARSCSMCGKSKSMDELVDLSANVVMKRTLTNICKVPSQDLERTLASVCVQCVYRININHEMTRSLKIRLHRLTNGQIHNRAEVADGKETTLSVVEPNGGEELLTPSSLNTSKSNPCNGLAETPTTLPYTMEMAPLSTIPSEKSAGKEKSPLPSPKLKKVCNSNGSAVNVSQQTQQNADSRNKYVVEVEEISPVKSDPVSQELSPRHSISNSQNSLNGAEPANYSMLEVVCERSESALITESGGKINNYRRSRSAPQQLACQRCSRTYWRKDYYLKHTRRCHARYRQNSAVLAAEARSAKSVANSKKSVIVTKTANNNDTNNDDEVAIESRTKKTKEPKSSFHCDVCAVSVETATKLRAHKKLHLPRYYCEICGGEYSAVHAYDFHRVVCEAKQNVLDYATETYALAEVSECAVPKISSRLGRVTRSRSRLRSVCEPRKEDEIQDDPRKDDNSDIDDEQDEVSVADTMYTKRMAFTGNWIEDHKANIVSSLDENNYCDEEVKMDTYKEFDLHLLDRLKAEINMKLLTCFAPECTFRTTELVKLMLHDYANHFKWAWFYCNKCGDVFTSKVFLDYHLDCQNDGRFICFKCGDVFEYQHQLDRHLILHTKFENYRCNYCNFEFLSENELMQHCDIKQHNHNDERQLIRIDNTMTIANEVPQTSIPYQRSRDYTVRVIEMRLPPMPSHRPMQLPGHKPYRRHVGNVEFNNQREPNCWGWK